MALVTCPDCGKEISDQAPACPNCGRPAAARPAVTAPPPATKAKKKTGCLIRSILGLIGLCVLLVIVGVIGRVVDLRQEERSQLATPTPDPRQDAAWLKTPGGKLYSKMHVLYPTWEREFWDTVADHKVHIGMTAEQCELSWGKPDNVNRTTTAAGSHEQWCYGESCSSALYFDGGVLTAIQD